MTHTTAPGSMARQPEGCIETHDSMDYARQMHDYIMNWVPIWVPQRWAIEAQATTPLRLDLIGAFVRLGDEYGVSDNDEGYVKAREHTQALKDICDQIDAAKERL